MLHWPTRNWDATLTPWKAAEEALADSKTRAIGGCNSLEDRLDAMIAANDVVPAVNQIELHPYFAHKPLVAKSAWHRET